MIIDKFIKYKRHSLLIIISYFFIIFLSIVDCEDKDDNNNNSTNSTNNENISLDAQCNGNTLIFYIQANLKQYLECLSNNFSKIENTPIYSSVKDIKTIGVVKGTIYEDIIQKFNSVEIKSFKSYEELISELRKNSINAFITSKQHGDIIKIKNGDLTYNNYDDNNAKNIKYKIFVNKSNNTNNIINKIQFQISKDIEELKEKWFGCNNNNQNINKILTGNNGILNIGLNYNEPPFSYLDSNGNNTGLIIDLLYRFANNSGYYLNIMELKKENNLSEIFTNDKITLACFLTQNESLENQSISEIIINNDINTVIVIKKQNSNNSEMFRFYDSIEDFNDERLGVVNENLGLTQKIFNNSKIIMKQNIYELFNALLLDEINGFLVDELTAKYYEKHISERLIYFPKILSKNNIGFIFTNETIKMQFNEFISNIKKDEKIFDEIFNETQLINNFTENDLNNNETINVIIDKYIIPFVYIENDIYKGYEINLLYIFASQYNYTLIFNSENMKNNVHIGNINITPEKNLGYFTDTIYESNIVLATKKNVLKDYITIKTLDSKYREKIDNDLLFTLRFSQTQKDCFCIIPRKYSNNIILKCSIFGIYAHNRFNGYFEYGENNNKIKIMDTTIEAKNFIEANSVFPGYNIINQSDMTNITCPTNINNNNKVKVSSSGFVITTASIVGLVLVGIFLAGAILTTVIMYRKIKYPKAKQSPYIDTSSKYNIAIKQS